MVASCESSALSSTSSLTARCPPIYNALTVEAETPIGHLSTILEVESQLPGGVVRTVAMSSTDGLRAASSPPIPVSP